MNGLKVSTRGLLSWVRPWPNAVAGLKESKAKAFAHVRTHDTKQRVALLLVAALLQGCSQGVAQPAATPATTAATTPEVVTVIAKAAAGDTELRLPARAMAGEVARLYARATGFVNERKVDLGDTVKAGDVLAVIAAPEIDQAVNEAQASVGQAKADLALAQQNFDRAASLVKMGAVSSAIYEERQAGLNVAKAALTASNARLTSSRERQAFQVVRAPFDGVVSARNVERGDRVVGDAAATMPMFEIAVLDPLRVVVDVPQSAVLQIRPGQIAQVRFPELPGEALTAEVKRSAQRISEDAGGMRVELELPNPDGRLPAGMVGEVRMQLPRITPAVILPVAAVVQGGGGARVAVVDSASAVRYHPVIVGRNLGNEVEVLAGIEVGATVILAPNALLTEGGAVRVKAPSTP